MTTLELRDLSFAFTNGRQILKTINLCVRRGECVGIIGGNGSGKSTLLRLAAGLLEPTSGSIFILNENGATESVQYNTALIMQNPEEQAIAPTVEEEIALALELRGVKREIMRARVQDMLVQFDLEHLRKHPPDALSGGQKQRVALAAIMVAEPTFLLFDEPDALLDAPSRTDFLDAVSRIRKNCGMIWSCADPDRMYGDKFFRLENGLLHPSSQDDIKRLAETAGAE